MTSTSVPLPTRLARFVLEDYHRYRLLEGLYRTVSRGPVPGAYPTDLNVELTSACNAKCDFCTHDRLVSQRIRPSKHMDLSFAESVLAKLRVLVDGLGIPEDGIRFGPVGLGEPLLYPNLAG